MILTFPYDFFAQHNWRIYLHWGTEMYFNLFVILFVLNDNWKAGRTLFRLNIKVYLCLKKRRKNLHTHLFILKNIRQKLLDIIILNLKTIKPEKRSIRKSWSLYGYTSYEHSARYWTSWGWGHDDASKSKQYLWIYQTVIIWVA